MEGKSNEEKINRNDAHSSHDSYVGGLWHEN